MFFVAALIGGGASQLAAENPIDQYYAYAATGEWQQALPIIEGLAKKDPSVPTSWYNYGICLEELKRHSESISAFKKAYELDASDFGAQYRIFKNYALAEDDEGFVAFAESEVVKTPRVIDLISGREEFKAIVSSKRYNEFKKQL